MDSRSRNRSLTTKTSDTVNTFKVQTSARLPPPVKCPGPHHCVEMARSTLCCDHPGPGKLCFRPRGKAHGEASKSLKIPESPFQSTSDDLRQGLSGGESSRRRSTM